MNIMMGGVLIALFALAGCAEAPRVDPARDVVFVTSYVVKTLPTWCDSDGFGCWRQQHPGISEIYVLSEYYPACLAHEMRHAHEGQWHPGAESVEDC